MNCWSAILRQDWRCPMCRSEVLMTRVVPVQVPKAFLQKLPVCCLELQTIGFCKDLKVE